MKVHVHLHTYALYTHMCVHVYIHIYTWLPKWLIGKESTFQAIDLSLIPELGRFPGEGNGNPLQYPCLGNPMKRRLAGCSPWSHRRLRHDLATKQTQQQQQQPTV